MGPLITLSWRVGHAKGMTTALFEKWGDEVFYPTIEEKRARRITRKTG
jgi:hypothetical protein